VHEPTGHATTATYVGYFVTASYDSSAGQSLSYTYGRTTASQGLSAHYGWQDPDGLADGSNTLSLNASDNRYVADASCVYNVLGDPSAGSNLPAADGTYRVQFKLTASTPTLGQNQNSTVTATVYTVYSTNGGASWLGVGAASQVTVSQSTPGFASTTQVFTPTLTFSGGGPVWIRLLLQGQASGNVGGGQVKVQIYANTGWATDPYAVAWSSYSSGTPLVAIQGGPARLDYVYHDGSQGLPARRRRCTPATHSHQDPRPRVGPSSPGITRMPTGRTRWSSMGADTRVGGPMRSRRRRESASGGRRLGPRHGLPLQQLRPWRYNDPGERRQAGGDVRCDQPGHGHDERPGYVTRYAYGATGLTRVTDPKGQVYKFDRNPWGVVVAQHDLGDTTKVDSLKYDVAGQARTAITRRETPSRSRMTRWAAR